MNRGPFYPRPASAPSRGDRQADFDEFEATELYCPKCGQAVPVRKTLLLVLPDGDKYEYQCRFCGSKVGDKMDRNGQFFGVIRP